MKTLIMSAIEFLVILYLISFTVWCAIMAGEWYYDTQGKWKQKKRWMG